MLYFQCPNILPIFRTFKPGVGIDETEPVLASK